jgi:alginate O-acetyltransferase complex protein AlgI
MGLLAFALFAGCKWLTWRRTPPAGIPGWRHWGYLLAWPGLDATAFLLRGPIPAGARPTAGEWGSAAAKFLLGGLLLRGLARMIPASQEVLRGWVGMAGIALVLHFGAFHLLSCAWRSAGIDARPLMNRPLASGSVSEFWGKRWNTAFRDLTHRFLFRPLTARWGPRRALVAGFLVSGLVHELLISVPAGGGYGGPTLYFVLQAAALLAERSRAGQTIGLGRGWRGRCFTLLVVGVPAYGLFHPPFVRNVILPLMGALGAVGKGLSPCDWIWQR